MNSINNTTKFYYFNIQDLNPNVNIEKEAKWKKIATIQLKCGFYRSYSQNDEITNQLLNRIIKLVSRPYNSVYIFEGESLSFSSALLQMINKIKMHIKPSLNNAPFLHNRYTSCLELIEVILNNETDFEIKERAQEALSQLEKVFPRLRRWNDQVVQLLYTNNKETQLKAGQTLTDWLKQPNSALKLDLPISPHRLDLDTLQCYNLTSHSLINHNRVPHPIWQAKKIYMGKTKNKSKYYFKNLEKIGEKEGLPKPEYGGLEWLRDNIIYINEMQYLISSPINIGVDNFFKPPLIQELLGSLIEPINLIMGASSQQTERYAELTPFRIAPFYFEGGNLIQTVDSNNHIVFLCGASNILYSILNSKELINENEKESLANIIKYLDEQNRFNEETLTLITQRLNAAGLLSDFQTDEKQTIAKIVFASIEYYLNKMRTTLDYNALLIGEVFEHLPEFHLDMFLLPAPNGCIYIQDHSLSYRVLKRIEQKYGDSLSDQELQRLEEYKMASEIKEELVGGSLEKIKCQLENSGFTVIPVPGIFYDMKEMRVNFLNSIVGVGEEKTYCITNGSSHSIDRFLRDAFASILFHTGIEHVYFTGRSIEVTENNPYPPHQFVGAKESLSKFGGIHCRTQAISTKFGKLNLDVFDKKSHSEQNIKNQSVFVGESLPIFFSEMLTYLKTKE